MMVFVGRLFRRILFLCILVGGLASSLQAQKGEPTDPPEQPLTVVLTNTAVHTNGWVSFQIQSPTNVVYEVQAGRLPSGWTNIANLHGPDPWSLPVVEFLRFVDPQPDASRRFFRVAARERGPNDDWKNQLTFADDLFARETSQSFSGTSPRWVKFTIQTNEPTRVYFQNGNVYNFHYDFAKTRLTNFAKLSAAEFDAVTLHPLNQKAILGAALLPPRLGPAEFAIQLAGMEAYAPETVLQVADMVEAAIAAPQPLKRFYFPTYEQQDAALLAREFFRTNNLEVSSIDRWIQGNVAYSQGWGVGRLVFIAGSEIEAAYKDGRLKPTDILVTDGVPAEVPFVSGIISLSPSTPNSHVALLAQSQGIPFIYLADSADRQITNLVGRQIAIGSALRSFGNPYKVLDLSAYPDDVRTTLLNLKAPPLLEYTPKVAHSNYVISVDALIPADAKIVGGKAANFGTLRRSLPTNSPPAFAITFRLWDEFMSQAMPGGVTLQQRIAGLLAPFTNYPPNMGELSTALETIRDLIEDETAFTETQQDAIELSLMSFDPRRKIRFRSSTNVEDTETFIGAGLYDSYSGCLADDQDMDTVGPSLCDPAEARERGVFRAIRKVYASFYNDNAFLERLRRGVKESEVGMAVVVHYSVPDEFELANGVATATASQGFDGFGLDTKMVTQKGAVSITNPEGDARPEVVELSRWGTLETTQTSTLVPLGGHVLGYQDEYKAFQEMFKKAATEHRRITGKQSFTLDFEYKKIRQADGSTWLAVKQVREVPVIGQERSPSYLLNPPADFVVFQGEAGDVFGIHRLKSELRLSTDFVRLSTNMTASFLGESRYAVQNLLETNVLTGRPSTWPNATFAPEPNAVETTDSWTVTGPDGARTMTLGIRFFDPFVRGDQFPVKTIEDAYLELKAVHAKPLPSMDWQGLPSSTEQDIVRLSTKLQRTDKDLFQQRSIAALNGAQRVQVDTSFYWPPHPGGVTVGYTAPLVEFVKTTITGLSAEPIELTGYYSQSYRPGHHNFTEDFIFEPQLDPGVSPATLAALRGANIRLLYVHWGGRGGEDAVYVLGFDNQFRKLAGSPQPGRN